MTQDVPLAPDPGHKPVMLDEVLEWLAPRDGEIIVDGTFGGGGYSRAILGSSKCTLIGIDRDVDAIERARKMAEKTERLVPLLGRFGEMDDIVRAAGYEHVDGVVLDIGVSSFQIDQAARGFSFMKHGPLDMRMGDTGPTAADVVNMMSERDLANIIFRLGEERQARRIARAIVLHRDDTPFETTTELADAVEKAVGGRKGARIHPATLTFQAIRMYVNDELGELARALHAAERLLRPGGRLVIVAFHSLEDRMVKQWLKNRAGKMGGGSRHLPVAQKGPDSTFELAVSKAVLPSDNEVEGNPRARSAKLRAAIRTSAPAIEEEASDGMNLPPLSDLEDAL
ncbi:MAG TPA: 16S rRNA (cytosine(1402)-N(4))-methyltransferase [Hyphomonas sp.]|uniref:16S rRNA (cytosine(1402)-N(4))-methyltransferase RsmH n=3 Tax=Hyphomonas TaxID=85 RepID=UPI000C4B3C50|nr:MULTISPECIES: 16S rRNA (cytosine(1402)-N(4))-methyltransferase RsmH [unclassified Hyphomonas]HBT44471.1 16S rRNA (cytosine(1402)-N(4))-methyltransferase [Rhodospirillaceae bacterium]MAL46101.1 16S rRNA (cytosine(1402)-N(4))-methyltransferase [Hyphomonas sp.]MAX82995.1 16S rRNA (cytosine(1402)-N(4))-methyltransferase [Hyphomonas sp.]HAO35289.1 16S rRNA (cytosine(1402)-N(4))-methyltransferase [Hyphomonas sp.]HBN91746.1 16S rRNA (cytosine(1402)-N(4))-methyltransferase [Hyphomonas sp.]|tara:strand:- start:1649 stop:2671 length:1023 start_codon:yes stop_codon:yes gene_type:complete